MSQFLFVSILTEMKVWQDSKKQMFPTDVFKDQNYPLALQLIFFVIHVKRNQMIHGLI